MNDSASFDSRRLHPVVLLAGTPLVDVSIGIVTIPALLHLLKNETFAAWALLYALSFRFTMLDAGVPGSVRSFLAAPYVLRDWQAADRFFVGAIACPVVTFGFAAPFVVAASDPLARALRLPHTPIFDAASLVIFVFYSYFFCRGFIDGKDGLVFCMTRALYQGMVVAKKHDLRRRGGG